jgi:predicted nucleotidyltransferase
MILPSGLQLPEDRIADICRRCRVREVSVFGSYARGEARSDSDFDLMVELEPDAYLGWDFFGIAEEMERILGPPSRPGNQKFSETLCTSLGAARRSCHLCSGMSPGSGKCWTLRIN